MGHTIQARALAVEALALAQRRAALLHETQALTELSRIELALGHHDAAQAYATEAAQAAQEAETAAAVAAARLARGEVAMARGDRQAAAGAATWVLSQGAAIPRQARAQAFLLGGLARRAQADLDMAWTVSQEAGDRPTAWHAALALADLRQEAGDGDGAAHWRRAAEAELEAVAGSFEDPALADALRRHAQVSWGK